MWRMAFLESFKKLFYHYAVTVVRLRPLHGILQFGTVVAM